MIDPAADRCPRCGLYALAWRACKLVCDNCRSIILSCADSEAGDIIMFL